MSGPAGSGNAKASSTTPRSARLLRLAGTVLAGLGLLWLVVSALVYSDASSAVVAIPTEDDFWGYDYLAYVNAAERLIATGSLYQAETLSGPYRPGPFGLYMYAPPLGVSLQPATGLGFDAGMWTWYIAHVLALIAACVLLPVRPLIRLFTFVVAAFSFAVTKDMALGNVSVLILLPTVVAWRWLDRPLGSIAQAFAISIRPTLGILLIWQLLRRQWRAVAWTVLAGSLLIVFTLPFVGLEGYLDYLTVLRNMSDVTGVLYNYDLGSIALAPGAVRQAPRSPRVGYVIAIAAILLSLRRDRELGFVVTVMASLLLSPLLWDHYLAMLVLPAAFLAERGRPWASSCRCWRGSRSSTNPGRVLFPVIVVAATLLPFRARSNPLPGPRFAAQAKRASLEPRSSPWQSRGLEPSGPALVNHARRGGLFWLLGVFATFPRPWSSTASCRTSGRPLGFRYRGIPVRGETPGNGGLALPAPSWWRRPTSRRLRLLPLRAATRRGARHRSPA